MTERLSLQASLSDGIGLGLRAGLLSETESPIDLTLGFDELLFPVESHLFGRDSQSQTFVPGRAWVGVAQTWEFVRARAALTIQPVTDGLEYVPHFALETAFKWPVSVGWECSWEESTWRNLVGISFTLKPIEVSGGLSEFQAWIYRDGNFGWYNTPPTGAVDGIGNPGWWLSVKWDLPPLRTTAVAPMPVVQCPAVVLDPDALKPVVDLLQQRLMRADVAELSVRAAAGTTDDPLSMSVLRHRLLAGGASARAALWRIALDSQGVVAERSQAAITLGEDPQDADLEPFEILSTDPAPALRMESAMALGRIGKVEAYKVLGVLSRDPEESVRLAAKAAVEIGPALGK